MNMKIKEGLLRLPNVEIELKKIAYSLYMKYRNEGSSPIFSFIFIYFG